ncbi:hypothetical protein CF161_28284 [Pseudomonas sp. CF161]|nr:hypothetical protein CF161_28284 [Pseudomonas sp. CF161]
MVGQLKVDMNRSMSGLESNYKKVMSDVMAFYRKSTYTPQQLAQYAERVLSQESSTHG